MRDITVQDIRDWIRKPETQLFWKYMREKKESYDETTHAVLRTDLREVSEKGTYLEAFRLTTAMDTIDEIMDLPERQIIPDIEEKSEA
jgi:hypothetical protein